MSDGRVVCRRDSPVDHCREVAADRPDSPSDPVGLVLVSGGIVRRTLTERLAAEGIPTDLVRITTIEDLARDLVRESEGSPPTVLERPVRTRAVETVLDRASDRDTPLGAFARRVPYEGGDVLDGVTAELDEYHRCTDAAADHDALVEVVEALRDERPFAAEATLENVRAFRALTRRLEALAGDRFVSRSHLVRRARDRLDAWSAVTGDPEWVALSTVSAVDDPTLRLLTAVAARAPLHLFLGAGTASGIETRLRASAVPVTVEWGPREGSPGTEGGRRLLAAAADHDEASVGAGTGVEAVAVPDRRREVEYALADARRRRREGETTLVVARDAGDYRTPVRDVSATADLPAHVETRRDVAARPSFRAVAATVRLIASAAGTPADGGDAPDRRAAGDAVAPHQVIAPLRAGVCLPAGVDDGRGDPGPDDSLDWPPSARAVGDVADALRARAPRSLDDWRADLPGDEGFEHVHALLSFVDRHRDPPADGDDLQALVDALLAARVDRLGDRDPPDFAGVAVDPARARAAEKWPAYHLGQVRAAAAGVGDLYDWLRSTLDRPGDWATAAAAVSTGPGAESYGLPDDDAGTVPVVDAGNAHFRRADRVYVLGLAAERFPSAPRGFAFLHRAVREAVHRRAPDHPYLYLNGEAAQYERDLDVYEAALRAATGGITLVWPYKDADDRDRPPSPFLDAVSVADDSRTRVDLGDWVGPFDARRGANGRDGTGDGPDPWRGLAPKERLRALAHFADRPAGGPDADRLRDLAAGVDPDVARRVLDGVERFDSLLEADDDD